MRHLRAAGMCNREPRLWFAAHGFSWSDFVTNGISIEEVEATGDPLGMVVVEVALREEADAQRR